MMNWPKVLQEEQTLDLVVNGASISRFGDGEFNLAIGKDCITQPYSKEIGARLREILFDPGMCLVGIPRIGVGPKKLFWQKFYNEEILKLFGQRQYVSSFISRPDSAPWIDTNNYWSKVKRIWFNKQVTLVRGSDKSLTAFTLNGAKKVREILIPKRTAFVYYDDIVKRIGNDDIVLLCAGPTATILAYDLCQKGTHAIDLGHIGMFLNKHWMGKPMVVTEADKAVDRI